MERLGSMGDGLAYLITDLSSIHVDSIVYILIVMPQDEYVLLYN